MEKNLSRLIEKRTTTNVTVALNAYSAQVSGSGLYDGLMGLSICYFILSKLTDEQRFRRVGKRLLSEVQKSIAGVDDLGFANGLAGIGWSVEWLVRNNFISANTDVILEELDDVLYESVVYAKDVSLSLMDGSIGKAMYFLSRYEAENPRRNRYRFICNVECLVLLSDEIFEKLLDESIGLLHKNPSEIVDSQLQEIAQSLILMLRLNTKKINTQVTGEILRAAIMFSETYILVSSREEMPPHRGEGFFHLVYAYFLASEILGKRSFTNSSYLVFSHLLKIGITPENVVQLSVGETQRLAKTNTGEGTSVSLLSKMLTDVNAIVNTDYGYEAFMLNEKRFFP